MTEICIWVPLFFLGLTPSCPPGSRSEVQFPGNLFCNYPHPIQTTHACGYCQCCWDTTKTGMSLRAEASKCQLLPCLHFLLFHLLPLPPFTGVCLTSGCGSVFVSLFGSFYESVTTLNPVNTEKNESLFLSSGSSQPGREDRNGRKRSYSADEVYAECQEKTRKGVLLPEGSETAPQRRKFEP